MLRENVAKIKQTETAPANRWVVPFSTSLFAMLALQMSSLGFSPLLPSIQQEFRMSFSQVGLFTGMYGILSIVWSVPAGLLAKRIGEKRVLIAGLLGTAAGLFLLSRATDFLAAAASRAVWLSGYRFGFVCVLTAIALTCPPSFRSSSMGILGATSSFASFVGAPFGVFMGRDLGWRGGFLAFSGMALAAALVVWAFYRNSPHVSGAPSSASTHRETASPSTKSAFRSPVVWAMALLVGLSGIPSFGVTFFVPMAAKQLFSLDGNATSLIISMGYAAALFVNLLFGYLMDRYNKWIVLIVLLAMLIPCCLLMVSPDLLTFRFASVSVLALGFPLINQVYGLAGDVFRGRETGNVMGVMSLGAGVFGYIGPQMLGSLRDWTGGFSAGWHMITGIVAAVLIETVLLKRNSAARRVAV